MFLSTCSYHKLFKYISCDEAYLILTVLLIGSSSHLQVTRTSITSRTSSKFGQIGPRTVELAALERLKNPHRVIIGEIL